MNEHETQANFFSSLNLHDEHVQAWTGQLDALHPIKLRHEHATTLHKAESDSMANAFDYWLLRDEIDSKPSQPASSDAPVQTAATPAPVVAVEPASDGPSPLTTGDIAYCFDGLRWNELGWRKPLGDKPKWLSKCVVIPGQRGVSETRWSPVLIGAELVRQGHVKARSMRSKFQTVDLLKPWLDEWKTYEADNLDMQ